ncbi:hypothetical protein CMUS01_10598 [Colletotrichum musicola]|uniref:Lysine-specific metallo-endopeptidase domain-containing protein n=1 Tax=Colletotrichum musicola TaxID=2175873 RepID=A0A8H6K2N5_9PEZI|nr:hypothetical protein CMUS01_10598 [Colletotrichum musicola]
MAKALFLPGLIAALLAFLTCTTTAVEITDIFSVEDGTRDGGCDHRAAVLDQWLSETIGSIVEALNAIERYEQDIRVRRSMSAIFGIRNAGRRTAAVNVVRASPDYIDYLETFFNNVPDDATGKPTYSKEKFWLFCDSTFLSLHDPTDPASDYEGNEIKDENDDSRTIRIMDVPTYQKHLAEDSDNKPWYSGELTKLNGYYFTEYGGNYCYDDDLGITAAIYPLTKGANGAAEGGEDEGVPVTASIVVCPHSFDGSPRPNSYREANALIRDGTNLADAVPKSATLLHEAFHAIHGDGFLSGSSEQYDIASCLNLPAVDAQKNPENYIFFIAHMYHLFGESEGTEPWSIDTNWDFAVRGRGQNRIFGAIEPQG